VKESINLDNGNSLTDKNLGNPSLGTCFKWNNLVLLVDRKGRKYLITLKQDESFHTHLGYINHNDIVGNPPGSWFFTTNGHRLLGLNPTLSDFILEMDRATQVIYPKDIGTILMSADIFPGAIVVEAGFGSGALTLALLRSVGQTGKVITYDLETSKSAKSLAQITPFMPKNHSLTVKEGDIYKGISEREIDRLILDLPEPWQAVEVALSSLTLGGIFLSFLPTILQVHKLVESLNASGQFQLIETIEVLHRSWHVSTRSVRPDHRMVAHTGFITTARKCNPKSTGNNQ